MALLTARRVEPGYEAGFEPWAQGILDSAATFPGHLRYGLFRPSGGDAPWFLVHRFEGVVAAADDPLRRGMGAQQRQDVRVVGDRVELKCSPGWWEGEQVHDSQWAWTSMTPARMSPFMMALPAVPGPRA
ncbi:hypothetical protein ACNPQM_17535 [Streptomyces sp. NPDC056231]|uniref:hypothetical protein n=1 Tax=Streptomyces sp. NPDC056231 TaxID=3345755 RepID=UPI003AB0BE58